MNAVQKIIERAVNEAVSSAVNEASQLATRTTGDLLMEVSKRLPANAEIKLKNNVVRVQHCWHLDNLKTAEDIDLALSSNFALFG